MDYETLSRGVQSVPIEIKIKSLKGRIQAELDYIKKEINRTQSRSDYDKDERMFILNDRLSYCKEVSEIPINDDKDFEFVEWLFNGGHYRTKDEIEKKAKEFQRQAEEERIKRIRESEPYKKHYHPVRLYFSIVLLVPLILGAIASWSSEVNLDNDFGEIIYTLVTGTFIGGAFCFAFAYIPLLIVAGIITLVYCKVFAMFFDVPIDDDMACAVVGATVAGCTTYYLKTKIDKQKEATKTV